MAAAPDADVRSSAIAIGQTVTAHSRTALTGRAPPGLLRPLIERVLMSEPWDCSPLATELQQIVRGLAAEMRDCGYTPEHMIIALKRAIARGASRPSTKASDQLHYRMTLWGVREFFRCDW